MLSIRERQARSRGSGVKPPEPPRAIETTAQENGDGSMTREAECCERAEALVGLL